MKSVSDGKPYSTEPRSTDTQRLRNDMVKTLEATSQGFAAHFVVRPAVSDAMDAQESIVTDESSESTINQSTLAEPNCRMNPTGITKMHQLVAISTAFTASITDFETTYVSIFSTVKGTPRPP